MWSFRKDSQALVAAPDKLFPIREDFGYEFRRRPLRIRAEQRFGSRSPKEYPRLGAVSVGRRIEKELDAIEIFFF
jgi:hypothetical protein